MATPLVAGCCAVIRGCLKDNGTPTPSAALIKALLINGATEIRGQYNPSEIGDAPNSDAGFGRVNIPGSLASIVSVANQSGRFKDGLELTERAPDNTHKFTIPVLQNGPKTLKITLVWTDLPGSKLQNALDLIITDPAGTAEMHGNIRRTFTGPGRRQDANFDRKNNVQQVVWKETQARDYSVQIEANHITSNKGKQPFAYAWHLY
jgi:serine protease AprX